MKDGDKIAVRFWNDEVLNCLYVNETETSLYVKLNGYAAMVPINRSDIKNVKVV